MKIFVSDVLTGMLVQMELADLFAEVEQFYHEINAIPRLIVLLVVQDAALVVVSNVSLDIGYTILYARAHVLHQLIKP